MSSAGDHDNAFEDEMIRHNHAIHRKMSWRHGLAVGACCAAFAVGGGAYARAPVRAETFATPERAVEALSAAWRGADKAELLKIFGPAGEALVSSGDPVADGHARARLAAAFDKDHALEFEAGGKAVLVLGQDQWPYPIPIVKRGSVWRFDAKAGAEQILDRRIGRNELNAIKVCLEIVEAERDFAANAQRAGGVHEYAQRVESTAGQHDGLYWPATDPQGESVLGPFVAAAEAHGYGVASAEGRAPFHGYYYRILTGQGASAPGGARAYVVDGHMTRGFALVAFPAKYGDSGVMTFIVNQHGVLFEKNLGPQSAAIAQRMTVYDPDKSWKVVEP